MRRGVDDGPPAATHAQRAIDIEEARRVEVKSHVAVGGIDDDVFGSALDLEVTVCFQPGGGLVIDDPVGTQDVVSIVNDNAAAQSPCVADTGLAPRFPMHWHARGGRRLWLRYGENLLAWLIPQLG